jgi:outer membrane receptor for ferrienterochelin and colicin
VQQNTWAADERSSGIRNIHGLVHVSSIDRIDATAPSDGDLKRQSVEELMNIEVTSVERHPQELQRARSAIQVITQEDIRRSGATSLPEALLRKWLPEFGSARNDS